MGKKILIIVFSVVLIALISYYLYSIGFHSAIKQINNESNTTAGNALASSSTKNNLISSEISTSTKGLQLTKIKTYEIIPQGINVSSVWRPELNKIGNDFYYAFNKGHLEQGEFALVVLDENFKQKQAINLFSETDANYMTTDLRTAKDDNGNLWYAFESALVGGEAIVKTSCPSGGSCEINRNSIALYDGVTLSKTKSAFAKGCVVMTAIIDEVGWNCYNDKPASDDPTPFFYNGNYYVLTRHIQSSKMDVREFDDNLDVVQQYELNLPIRPGIAPNTVVEIEGKLYLITGVGVGDRTSPDYSSSIYAFELASDFSSVKNTIKLTNYNEMDSRVTSARYENGKLYFTYQDNDPNNFGIYLEVFDVNNNFASISRIKVFGQVEKDGHNSLELSKGKIYVAYVNANKNLAISEFELTNSGTSAGQTTSSAGTLPSQTPTGNQNQVGNQTTGGYCGDGICQDIEKSTGKCPADCK